MSRTINKIIREIELSKIYGAKLDPKYQKIIDFFNEHILPKTEEDCYIYSKSFLLIVKNNKVIISLNYSNFFISQEINSFFAGWDTDTTSKFILYMMKPYERGIELPLSQENEYKKYDISKGQVEFLPILSHLKNQSNDERTKIGSIILDNSLSKVISTGWNKLANKVVNSKDRQMSPKKHNFFIHAEQNAILNAAKEGKSTKNTIMIMTCGIPCPKCASSIIESGIKTIVCKKSQNNMHNPEKWEKLSKYSIEMFKESGVDVFYWTRGDELKDEKKIK